MIPLPILAAGALTVFVLGLGSGYRIAVDHHKAGLLEQERAAAVAYEQRTNELNQVSAELERARHDRKVVYRTITQRVEKVVARDVYRQSCLDSDGVLLINSALAGRASPGEPADAVPAAGAAAGNDRR